MDIEEKNYSKTFDGLKVEVWISPVVVLPFSTPAGPLKNPGTWNVPTAGGSGKVTAGTATGHPARSSNCVELYRNASCTKKSSFWFLAAFGWRENFSQIKKSQLIPTQYSKFWTNPCFSFIRLLVSKTFWNIKIYITNLGKWWLYWQRKEWWKTLGTSVQNISICTKNETP